MRKNTSGNITKLRQKAAKLKTEITAVYFAYQHPETGFWPKLIILITIGYALSPIDLIPDFIPVLGYLDDLIILPALISFSIKLIPKRIMDECRLRAKTEHMVLKKNKVFAVIFITIWIVLLTGIFISIYNLFRRR